MGNSLDRGCKLPIPIFPFIQQKLAVFSENRNTRQWRQTLVKAPTSAQILHHESCAFCLTLSLLRSCYWRWVLFAFRNFHSSWCFTVTISVRDCSECSDCAEVSTISLNFIPFGRSVPKFRHSLYLSPFEVPWSKTVALWCIIFPS